MGAIDKIKNLFLEKKNQIYVFLFINYILFFLIKTIKILFFEFTSNKKLPLIIYLFWAIQSFLVKKSSLVKILIFLIILALLILDFIICCNIWKLLKTLINNHKFKNKTYIVKSDYFIIAFLLVLSAFLRFGFLNAGLYHHDSFQTAVAAEKTVNEWKLYSIGGGRQGVVLVNSVFFYFFKIFFGHKSAEFSVNFSSAMFGTLSIAVLYILMKNLTSNKFISFSSSILYSVTPIFLSVSTFAKEHTLDAFTALLSFLLLAIGLKKSNYFLIFLSGLFLSFLIFIRFPSVLAAFCLIFLIYNLSKINKTIDNNPNKLKAFCFFLIPFAVFVISYVLYESDTLLNEAKSNFNSLSLDNFNLILLNFDYSIKGIIFSLTLFGFLFSMIGLVLLSKENRHMFYFVLLFFIPLFIFYLFSKTIAHRFFVLPLVPLMISLSYTLDYIRKKDSYAAVMFLVLLAISSFVNIYPVIKTRHEFSAFKDLAAMVNANTSPENSIIILYGDDTSALNYYSKTPTKSCDYEPEIKSVNKFVGTVQNLLDKNLKVFISGACFGLGSSEEQSLFLELMNDNFKGSSVADYISDDYHRGSIKPTIKKISMIRLYDKNSTKGIELKGLDINY